eukprot:gnl/TRDRNA2_/TRDRNA2_173229_c0_seq5.p1 gnl/TRDRNA2_/TRDRNA2_173229_c0~~gnl/TRDRNA2_/TRDRNA2_173229_c0_seq5.p1  ORF type:complete len:896 (-),score=161.02 gnl/TRDRNA2_/TRDRNA2_173229_c0_seq5:19-2706(-)
MSSSQDSCEEKVGLLASLLDCDIEPARAVLACADGSIDQAVRIYFEQQQQIVTGDQNKVLSPPLQHPAAQREESRSCTRTSLRPDRPADAAKKIRREGAPTTTDLGLGAAQSSRPSPTIRSGCRPGGHKDCGHASSADTIVIDDDDEIMAASGAKPDMTGASQSGSVKVTDKPTPDRNSRLVKGEDPIKMSFHERRAIFARANEAPLEEAVSRAASRPGKCASNTEETCEGAAGDDVEDAGCCGTAVRGSGGKTATVEKASGPSPSRGSDKKKAADLPSGEADDPQLATRGKESAQVPQLPEGVYKAGKKGYKASISFLGFRIEILKVKFVSTAKKNREAMEKVSSVLGQRVVANPQAPEEFIKTVCSVVEEIRREQNVTSVWKYHSEFLHKPPGATKMQIVRFNTTDCLNGALNGWLATRKKVGIYDPIICVQQPSVERDRKAANDLAKQILAELQAGAAPSDEQVLQVLRKWGFEENTSRVNVLPDGKSFVHSDTLGLITARTSGIPIESSATKGNHAFFRLIGLWACSRVRERFGEGPIPYTTITINKNYRAKRHRDRNNIGPSVGLALGNFTRGGRLRYWTKDDKKCDLGALNEEASVLLDPGIAPVVFNGNLAHEVEDYEGEERFSIILFSHGKYELASTKTREVLQEAGCNWPSHASLQGLARWDPARSPVERPNSGKKSIKRLWSGKPSKRVTGKKPVARCGASSGSKRKPEMGEERPSAAVIDQPAKKPRQATLGTEKTWVCPFARCGHEMCPGSSGQVAHIARCHRQQEKKACGCTHGCAKCVPPRVRDDPFTEFRRAVVSGDGAKAAEQIAKLQNADDDSALVEARVEFLLAALEKHDLDVRKSVCTAALQSLPDHAKLSADARHLVKVFSSSLDRIDACGLPAD